MTKAVIDHALRLAARGVPVFPCKQDKKPHTARGFKDASTDAEIIRAWWDKHPDALIGVPVGARAFPHCISCESARRSALSQ